MANQGKAAKKQSVQFSRVNFNRKQRNPFFKFTCVFEMIELDMTLLVRVSEMLFWSLEPRLGPIVRF